MNDRITILEAELAEAKARIAKLDDLLNRYKTGIECANNAHTSAMHLNMDIRRELTAANATIAELRSELSRHQSLLTRATEALDAANATIAAMQKHGVVLRVTPTDATSDAPDYMVGTFINSAGAPR